MAITRAQQFRQMLEDGGMLVQPSTTGKRPGYSNPNEDRARERAAANEKAASNREARRGGQYSRSTTKQSTFDSEVEDQTSSDDRREVQLTGGDEGSGLARNREENITKFKKFKDTKPDIKTPPLGILSFLKTPFQKLSDFTTARNRKFFEDVVRAGKIPGVSFADLSNPNFNLEQEYQDYMKNRLAGKTDAYGNPVAGFSYDSEGNLVGNFRDDDKPLMATNLDPFKGKPADVDTDTETEQDDFSRFFRLLADGGRVEDMEREAMFIGGIVKGIKKAVRGVKKIAKSPIGKLAIGALLFKGVGGLRGLGALKGKLLGEASIAGVPDFVTGKGTMGILGKLGLTEGGGSLALTGLGKFAAMGVPAALAGVMTEKQKDQTLKQPDYPDFNMQAYLDDPYGYTPPRQMADGGIMRAGYQEGSKEPVAKKTMPLLDMDGKEMDLREEGGFVPIGRMEKADDVPARLSKNEFVFTADAVRNAGEGDIDKGAEVMYNMMKNLEAGGEVSEESQGLNGARKMFQTSQRLGEVL